VLSVLSSSAVIVDSADRVLQASAPAVAMGLLRDDALPEPVMELVHRWTGLSLPNWPIQLAGTLLLIAPLALRRDREQYVLRGSGER